MLVGDVTQSLAVNSTVEIIIAVVRGGETKGRTLREDPGIELTDSEGVCLVLNVTALWAWV